MDDAQNIYDESDPFEETASEQFDEIDDAQGDQDEENLIELAGERLTKEQVEGLVDFYRWAKANPEGLAQFDAYLQGQYELVPRGYLAARQATSQQSPRAEEDPFEGLDPKLAATLSQMQSRLDQVAQMNAQQQVVSYAKGVETAAARVKERYGLEDEDMERLTLHTARLQILPALMRQTGDAATAAEQAMELAYWQIPEFRDRELARRSQSTLEQQKRAMKASRLSGSSGSAPRNGSTPRTREERMAAMTQEIAQLMREG